jgi:hypothetical protein
MADRALTSVTLADGDLAAQLADAYLASLQAAGIEACTAWASRPAWKAHATRALAAARAMLMAMQPALREVEPALYVPTHLARATVADWGRTMGHFGLDAVLTDPVNAWRPPLLAAHLESEPAPDRVQYASWRLLTVKASSRMLVACFGESTPVASFEVLERLVREVCAAQAGLDVLLIGADLDARPRSVAELRGAHRQGVVASPAHR